MVVESPSFIHGPAPSARLGKTLTIDVTAPQNNLVVERGSVLARGSVVVTSSARRLIDLSKGGEKVETIAVVGSEADPASHPDLREITENLRVLRTKWFPRAKLALFTSIKDLDSDVLRVAMGMYDKLFFQFEWGTAKIFAAATGEKSTVLATLTHAMHGFDHMIVQANFFRGSLDNSTASEVTSWIKKLQDLRPQEVHILTGPGKQAKSVKAITPSRREKIAEEVAEATGIAVSIHEDEPRFA